MKITKSLISVTAAIGLVGCGTFQLSSGAIPNSPKSQQQMQLDNLTCKDQAKLEANTASRQVGAFALGFTIVGAPVAFELEKAKQREVYKSCMELRGYRVLPPMDGPAATTSSQEAHPKVTTPFRQPDTPKSTSLSGRDEAVQLEKLKELRDKGLISSDEFERKRKEILDRM